MSLIVFVGWEGGGNIEASASGGTQSVQSSVVRSGDYALQTNPTGTAVGYNAFITNNDSTGVAGFYSLETAYHQFYFRYATKPSSLDEELFTSWSSSALKFAVRIDSNGNLLAYDSALTLLDTGTEALDSDTWYRLDVKVGTGTEGEWEVKLYDEPGTLLETLSGTGDLLTTNNGQCRIGKVTNRNGNSVDFFYDDLAVDDTAYPTPGQTARLDGDGDGTYTDFTVGAGSGDDYLQVDDVPHDSDTTYLVSTLTVGHASTVTVESAASAGIDGTVQSVKHIITNKADGGAAGTTKLRLRSGSTDSDTASGNATGGGYLTRQRIFNTDPATGSAWTVSALDDLETGMIEAEATDKSRLTSTLVFVRFTPGGASTVTKTHTTDALLRATQTKTHTTDALLKATQTITHTTDALLRATLTQAHTTDALLRATQTIVHTTDALLRATLTRTHSTDALLRATETITHTTDALLKATLTKAHTTDALLRATVTKTHSTDALLKATQTKTHTTDALLRATQTKTHTTDAYLSAAGTVTKTHTTDALLKATRTLTHTTDAYLAAATSEGRIVSSLSVALLDIVSSEGRAVNDLVSSEAVVL